MTIPTRRNLFPLLTKKMCNSNGHDRGLLWICPPYNQLAMSVQKMVDEGVEALVVATEWTEQPWRDSSQPFSKGCGCFLIRRLESAYANSTGAHLHPWPCVSTFCT